MSMFTTYANLNQRRQGSLIGRYRSFIDSKALRDMLGPIKTPTIQIDSDLYTVLMRLISWFVAGGPLIRVGATWTSCWRSKGGANLCKMAENSRPSSDMAAFRKEFAKAKHIVVLTGAGVSAESGVPTFRGAGGFWRKWQAQELASPQAFSVNPSLVWEFYHYRREVMGSKSPNPAHIAIAEAEKRLAAQGRKVVVITQNIDELHKAARSQDILELHGSLFRIRCTKCGEVTVNRDSPICPALGGKGEPDPKAVDAQIPVDQLPKCKKSGCGGLLRPHVVWFGEGLERKVLERAYHELDICDLCLVVGTSSVVYPAAMFAPSAANRGVTVAEFNIEATDATHNFGYMFQGPAGEFLPKALARHESEPQ